MVANKMPNTGDLSSVAVHIGPKPKTDGDTRPQIIFGFTGANFSQAVYMVAPQNPSDALRAADGIYKAFLEACGLAVKDWDAKEDKDV